MSETAYRVSAGIAYVLMTAAIAAVLHGNPFGRGAIHWLAAIVIAAAGNAALAFVLAPRVGPYLVGSGHRYGEAAQPAEPSRVRAATLATAVTTMLVSLLCVWGVGIAASDPIIVPTERLERNAELARATINQHAPQEFRVMLGAADTWKVKQDGDELRTCVPAKEDETRAWCVRIIATDEAARVVSYGPGKPNALVYLEQEERKAGAAPVD